MSEAGGNVKGREGEAGGEGRQVRHLLRACSLVGGMPYNQGGGEERGGCSC
jgi:hypothetical protein